MERNQRRAGDLETRCNDAARLRFDTQDDALNFARKSVEDGRRWVRERSFSCSKDYLNNRSCINISGHTLPESNKFKFVAQIIPFTDADSGSCGRVEHPWIIF